VDLSLTVWRPAARPRADGSTLQAANLSTALALPAGLSPVAAETAGSSETEVVVQAMDVQTETASSGIGPDAAAIDVGTTVADAGL
jgi:hypothetical protein